MADDISLTINGQPAVETAIIHSGDTLGITIASVGERGFKGDTGATGPSNVLTIGQVVAGAEAAATITGTSPSQVLNLVLPKGDAGVAVELQSSSTHIQWRYAGASSWTNLVALSAITGPQGSTGASGTPVELQATSTHLQWRYVGGSTWTNVFALSSLVGPQGVQGPAGPAGPPINLGDETPQPLGTASAGTALTAARADHIHALPTSIPYASLTGVPTTFTPAVHQHAVADVTGLQAALDGKQAAGSYAPLVNNLVPSANLPSYVDDVVDVGGTLPATGEVGKIYVVSTGGNVNKIYRWSGSTFIEISPSPGSTDSVAEGSTNLYFTAARAIAAIPTASTAVSGIVRVGSGLSIDGSGVLSATGGGGSFSGTVDGGDYVGTGGNTGGGGGSPSTDPLWSSVRMLLHADSAIGSTSDSSTNGITIAPYGNVSASGTPKFGTGSFAFDGSGDYLYATNSVLAFGTGDFTAEAWVYLSALPSNATNNGYYALFDARGTDTNNPGAGYYVTVSQSGAFFASWGTTSSGSNMAGGSAATATWYHVALVRSSGSIRLYVNGVCVASSTTNTGVNMSNEDLYISRLAASSSFLESSGLQGYWNGRIDEIRLTAAARYTGTSSSGLNFTVPTAAFPNS